MYKALILIGPAIKFSMEEYRSALIDALVPHHSPAPEVTTTESGITIHFSSGFQISATYSCADHVLVESKDIAERFGSDRSDRVAIENADSRIEVSSSADYEMIHFNDFIAFVECAEKQGKVFAFDAQNSTFM